MNSISRMVTTRSFDGSGRHCGPSTSPWSQLRSICFASMMLRRRSSEELWILGFSVQPSVVAAAVSAGAPTEVSQWRLRRRPPFGFPDASSHRNPSKSCFSRHQHVDYRGFGRCFALALAQCHKRSQLESVATECVSLHPQSFAKKGVHGGRQIVPEGSAGGHGPCVPCVAYSTAR